MAEVRAGQSTPRSSRPDIATRSVDVVALPAELVTNFLGYLPNASLWQAAGVSRQFYTCAWDAGLYIHRKLSWGRQERRPRQLTDFDALVKHALPKNLRLSLSLWCSPDTNPAIRDVYDNGHPPMDEILAAITAALPLLVYLSIQVTDIEQVLAVLCRHPMPCLRELGVTFAPQVRSQPFPLPFDLLGFGAPLLRKLTLGDVTLTTPPLPAFSGVTSLSFTYSAASPNFAFAHHFPRISELSLRSHVHMPPPFQPMNLSGLSFRSLAVETGMLPAIRHSVALDNIPVLRCDHLTLNIAWLEPDSENYSLRLGGHLAPDSYISVDVVPAHRRWRRIYGIEEWWAETLPLAAKPGGTVRLTYLRVENNYLYAFLSCNAAFPALKHIKVDFFREYSESREPASVWLPDTPWFDQPVFAGRFREEHKTAPTFDGTESPYSTSCPALEQLTLFALDEITTVLPREVAFLGRALGQLARADGEKAILALVGVQFAEPQAQTLLGLTFSAVRRHAFAGRDSREDLDDGLWNQAPTA